MQVWVITVGEPLPGLSGNSRLWRTGLLCRALVERGHEVRWWTSRVDHFRKEFFPVVDATRVVEPGLTIHFLDGRLYDRNISVARLVNHWQIARAFREQCRWEARPDVILCSFPTIELADEAVRFGREQGVPVVLDVRDLWPDIFLQAAPPAARAAMRCLLHFYFVTTVRALRGAEALIAVSARYLDWGLQRAGRVAARLDRVFPLGYSLPQRTPSARAEGAELLCRYGVARDAVVCIFAGTLGRTYDLAPMLEAAATLATEGSKLHFVVCGEGERAAHWRERAAGLMNVTFTGWLDQRAMSAALLGADLGIAAYAKDAPQGLPNKVIEYLAAGLPVVSCLAGETAEMLAEADCGMTYVAGDADSFRAVLRDLEPRAQRERMAQNARRKFEASFRAETIYAELTDYLEEIARGSSRS